LRQIKSKNTHFSDLGSSVSFTERQACAVSLIATFADDLGDKGESGPIIMLMAWWPVGLQRTRIV
jgi:hypothetical protein